MNAESKDATSAVDEGQDRESGLPGGGKGRIDVTGHSGVYPASAPQGASGDATFHGEASWGQGERGAAGYEDHGESELTTIPPDAKAAGYTGAMSDQE